MSPILYVLVFLATLLAAEGAYLLIQSQRSGEHAEARKRLKRLASGLKSPRSERESALRRRKGENSFVERLVDGLPRVQSLELQLYRAGMTTTPSRLVAISLLVGLGAWLVGAVLLDNPAGASPLLAFGALPLMAVLRKARQRMLEFERQFPEALALLTRALRAGHSLSFGIQMIGEELPDPIGTEFTQVAEEVKMGQDFNTALANMVYRIDVGDLGFFATAIGIQRETGGNLTEILDKLDYVIRERFKLYGKIRALTAIGRASANLLACFPAVMVGGLYTVNKEYVAPLWETETGHMLGIIAFLMVIVGYALCRRMAQIRV